MKYSARTASVSRHTRAPEFDGALEETFVASRSKFVAIAYSILRNRDDAEVAVQNAFLSTYRRVRSFEGRSALRTWLTRIVMNAALMIQRKRKSFTVTPVPENSSPHEGDWIESIPVSQPDPETAHAEEETLDFINGVLGKMKPVLRQAFAMTYFDELSGKKLAHYLVFHLGLSKRGFFVQGGSFWIGRNGLLWLLFIRRPFRRPNS